MATECNDYHHHHRHVEPGLSGKDASFLGDINNCSDRANEARWEGAEFRSVHTSQGDKALLAQKDRADDARYIGGEFRAAQQDRADHARFVGSEFRDAQKDRADHSRWSGGEFGAVRKDICDSTGAIRKDICETNASVLGVESRLQRDIVNGDRQIESLALREFNALNVQGQTHAAAINLAIERTAYQGRLDAQTNAAAAALAAATNTAAILAAQEKCCCEMKELVRAQAEEGRLLQLKIQADNQATALSDAKQEILALRIGAGVAA